MAAPTPKIKLVAPVRAKAQNKIQARAGAQNKIIVGNSAGRWGKADKVAPKPKIKFRAAKTGGHAQNNPGSK